MSDPENHTDLVISSDTIVHKGFLSIRRMAFKFRKFDGTMSETVTRDICERGNSAAILPFDPVRDEVALIRQVLPGNIAAGQPCRPLQVIAGRVEPMEEFIDVVLREAQEEAGLTIRRVRPAHVFMPSPGGSSERIATFVGHVDLSQAGGIHGLAEEHEDIRLEILPARKAIWMLDHGEIDAGPAVVALSWFARHHARLRTEWRSLAP